MNDNKALCADSGKTDARDGESLLVEDDFDAINRLYRERQWSDGLPIVPPTEERVARMLACTNRPADEVVAKVAPAFGEATVKLIAINGVMAGCDPQAMPVLIAATEAMADPKFNLQALQATTNPVTVCVIINGPIVEQLGFNAAHNCMGEGAWSNATVGRAVRLILRNIGGALPGEMDRAEQGQPGRYTFCFAENEAQSPWPSLSVERGFDPGTSTVTVVGVEGTMNVNSVTKVADELLQTFARTMIHPGGNEYLHGGEPWLVLGVEHAEILHEAGYDKASIKAALWEWSKMPATQLSQRDFERTFNSRRSRLGDFGREMMLPISHYADEISLVVAGGQGTHTTYMPCFGNTRASTRAIDTTTVLPPGGS